MADSSAQAASHAILNASVSSVTPSPTAPNFLTSKRVEELSTFPSSGGFSGAGAAAGGKAGEGGKEGDGAGAEEGGAEI